MNKLLHGMTAVAFLAAPALAADIPARRSMPVKAPLQAAVGAYSWTGCYVGAHVGGLWGDTEWSSDFANTGQFIYNQTYDYSSVTGGGHIGCNYQVNQIVFGIEGDVSAASSDESSFADVVANDEVFRTKFNWYASVRGRLGLAWDRSLIYATGGVALSRITHRYELVGCVIGGCLSETRASTGWVVGGGFEYAFTGNWTGRAEYLYFDFGNENANGPANFPGFTLNAHTRFHVGRVGLSYKFGPSAVVARY